MWIAVHHGWYALYVVLVPPAAGLLVRMFLIQHDCGHGSFLPNKDANDWLGRAIGVLTFTPYDHWRRSHAIHHATAGNLERRGIGDIDTLTVAEYSSRSKLGRLRYRLYRHPLVMFGLGPLYTFLIENRLPFGFMRIGWMPWLSTMGTNAGIALASALMIWLIGAGPFLLVHLPVMALAATFGVWLFYVQHQFDGTHWAGAGSWNAEEAALLGSSHYDLPQPLRWLTANIGVHHVHHLSSRIPFYRLQKVLRDHPELKGVSRLTLWRSFSCLRLALWDEAQHKMVSFREARRQRAVSRA
jgi:acyl-lipid omega-6 desaturase (Delta-12 desaturase)